MALKSLTEFHGSSAPIGKGRIKKTFLCVLGTTGTSFTCTSHGMSGIVNATLTPVNSARLGKVAVYNDWKTLSCTGIDYLSTAGTYLLNIEATNI